MENLKKKREAIGMSQTDLAARLGMSRPTLIKVEKGERELTDHEKIKAGDIFKLVESLKLTHSYKPDRKMCELILCILSAAGAHPNFGMVQLLKTLDRLGYCDFHRNIAAIKDMIQRNQVEEVDSPYFTFDRKKHLPITAVDFSAFSVEEFRAINDAICSVIDD